MLQDFVKAIDMEHVPASEHDCGLVTQAGCVADLAIIVASAIIKNFLCIRYYLVILFDAVLFEARKTLLLTLKATARMVARVHLFT